MNYLNVCPKCRSLMKVRDTRHSDGEIYRRRQCDTCGHTLFSLEFEVEDNDELRAAWRGLASARYGKLFRFRG